MKTRLIFAILAATLVLPVAATAARKKESDDRPKLAIVVSESLGSFNNSFDDFIRFDIAFTKVAEERKWPVQIVAERFAANLPDYENEVEIFTQPLRQWLPGEYTLRGWLTLTAGGKEHDFGIVSFDYRPRLGEPSDRLLEAIFLGFANAAADKIEPILFPKEDEKPAP